MREIQDQPPCLSWMHLMDHPLLFHQYLPPTLECTFIATLVVVILLNRYSSSSSLHTSLHNIINSVQISCTHLRRVLIKDVIKVVHLRRFTRACIGLQHCNCPAQLVHGDHILAILLSLMGIKRAHSHNHSHIFTCFFFLLKMAQVND